MRDWNDWNSLDTLFRFQLIPQPSVDISGS